MKAVVLAGGYATRLRPISYTIPKLLFPVLGKPTILWVLDALRKNGIDEVIMAVNYLAEPLQDRVGEEYEGMKIRCSQEPRAMGTAGAFKLAAAAADIKQTFVVMSGDIIADINLSDMLQEHELSGAAVTDAIHEVENPATFGLGAARTTSNGRILRFVRKASYERGQRHLINAGIYVVEPRVLRRIPRGQKASMYYDIFPLLIAERKLFAFAFSGTWFDIGNFNSYRKANFTLLGEYARQQGKHLGGVRGTQPVLVGKQAIVQRGAKVGPNVIVGDDCRIARGASVANSILFGSVDVKQGASVSGATVASNVRIGVKAAIGAGTVISEDVLVRDGVRISTNVVIHPRKQIAEDLSSGSHIM